MESMADSNWGKRIELDSGRHAACVDWIGRARDRGVEIEGRGHWLKPDATISVVPWRTTDAAIGVPDLQGRQQSAVPVDFQPCALVEVGGAQRPKHAAELGVDVGPWPQRHMAKVNDARWAANAVESREFGPAIGRMSQAEGEIGNDVQAARRVG